jgi:TonB family protein
MRHTSRFVFVALLFAQAARAASSPPPTPTPDRQARKQAYEALHPGVVWPLGIASEPRQLVNVKPAFPEALKKKQRSLDPIMVIAVITASGQVADPAILSSTHPDLNPYVLSAVEQWRYEPPLVKGKPAPVFLIVTVMFHPAM